MSFDHWRCQDYVLQETDLGYMNRQKAEFISCIPISFTDWDTAERALLGCGAEKVSARFDLKQADWKGGPEGMLLKVDAEIKSVVDSMKVAGWKFALGSLRVECDPEGVGCVSVWMLPPVPTEQETPSP